MQQMSTPHMIKSAPCTHLPVTDLDRSVSWWAENFGVTVHEYTPGSGKAELRVENGHWLYLYEAEAMPSPIFVTKAPLRNSDDNQLYVLTLEVKEPEALYQRLQQNGTKVGSLHQAWGTAFDCYDPDGNKFNIWGGEWVEE